MHAEIEQSLQVEAATVSQDIDKMMFERLQNARTWSRLEVMQEIQIGDVDKRLSKFLSEAKSGYRDVYDELLCTDADGHVTNVTYDALGQQTAVTRTMVEGDRTVQSIDRTTDDLSGHVIGTSHVTSEVINGVTVDNFSAN